MTQYMINYSIIIPQRNSLNTLPRLFQSIPQRDDIEIVLVDNSEVPITKDQLQVERDFVLLWSPPQRYAGGARNVGIENSHGKWLLFADADDFFPSNAFDFFDSFLSSSYDLIFFKSESVYDDTLEKSVRSDGFNNHIDNYLASQETEECCRLSYLVPWGKLIKKELIDKCNIRFDEVLAANDVVFATKAGFFAESFHVDSHVAYVITTRRGSLSNRWDYPVIESRFYAALRRNRFLKDNGLGAYQSSIMIYLYKSLNYGLVKFFNLLFTAIRYRQNIFVGASNWFKSYKRIQARDLKNKAYVTSREE